MGAEKGFSQLQDGPAAALSAAPKAATSGDVKPHAQEKDAAVKPVGAKGEVHKEEKHDDGKSEISGAVFNLANAVCTDAD